MDINFEVLESQTVEAITEYFKQHKVAFLHTIRAFVVDVVPDAFKLSDEAIDEVIVEAINRQVIDRWLEVSFGLGKFAVTKTGI